MDARQFAALAERLENLAREAPQRYLLQVFGIAALGFAILGLVVGIAVINLALIAGLVLLVFATGGKALLFFAKLGKLLIALALPAWAMLRATVTLIFARFPRPQGRELTRSEAPALFARLDAMRKQLGGPRMHRVLLTDELNAAIVQHPRLGLFGWEENTLILGLRLLQALDEEEAMAVIAHEYGHLAGHHSRFGGFIYRFRSAWGRLQELSEQWNDWGSRLIARLFRWYAPRFNAWTFALARQNEYVADRTAVELVGRDPAANALMRTGIASRFEAADFWPQLSRRIADEAEPPANRSLLWADALCRRLDAETRQRYLAEAGRTVTDKLDTHPALVDRLDAIGIRFDHERAAQLTPPPRSAADVWLAGRLAAIHAEFDQRWVSEIGDRWRERHDYLRTLAARAAELAALETPDAAQQWEYIEALGEIEPDRDIAPMLKRLLAEYPEHLPARFRHACLRLDSGDESAVDDLEGIVADDPSATMPVCATLVAFYERRAAAGDDERAEACRARWQVRSDYEAAVRTELARLPADARLADAGVDTATRDAVRQVLQSSPRHIRRAWLLRRILKSDPSIHDYVLAFENSRFTFGDKGAATAKRLAALEWPLALFIVPLSSTTYRSFRKSIRKQGIAPLEFR